jgi:hypothetical protein
MFYVGLKKYFFSGAKIIAVTRFLLVKEGDFCQQCSKIKKGNSNRIAFKDRYC